MSELEHRTTARIFDVLEIIAQHEGGISFSDIARQVKVPKGSLHPLLATMVKRGYLHYKETERRYYIGAALFVLGRGYISANDILDSIAQEVRNLAAKVEETVFFGTLDNGDMLYLTMSDSFTKIKVVSSPGRKLPAYSTGCGKALLSQFSPAQIKQLYPNGLHKVTPNTISSFEELNRQLAEVRSTGFAYEQEESTQYICCVGVPICHQSRYLAALSVATPVLRYSAEKENQVKLLLLEAKVCIEAIISSNIARWNYS